MQTAVLQLERQNIMRLPADPSQLAVARQFAEEAAERFGLDETDSYQFKLAVSEAVANAIEHGCPFPDGTVALELIEESNSLSAEVTDCGVFTTKMVADQGSLLERGRGLAFMTVFVDELERALVIAGTDVLVAGGGEEGLARVGADGPDVVVVSSELPDMDPLWVCRRLREARDPVPVLVMSAEGDPISALNAGADDFMPRGSSIGELHARLRALTRRSSNGSTPSRLEFEELELDVGEHSARIGERVVRLTRTEFELLHLFMRNPRRVLPHELIYESVWGYDFALAGNTLRVYVGYLRRKLEANGERRLLHTVRGVGYVLREP